ncbi:MAG: hypothetical protein ACPG4U_17175, partial [Pseudomonadales bacterium]
MNLAKRTSFLILPVVVLCYGLITWFVYVRECAALEKLEQSRLELQVEGLKTSFTQYTSFSE